MFKNMLDFSKKTGINSDVLGRRPLSHIPRGSTKEKDI
jgi:hypothetical protein